MVYVLCSAEISSIGVLDVRIPARELTTTKGVNTLLIQRQISDDIVVLHMYICLFIHCYLLIHCIKNTDCTVVIYSNVLLSSCDANIRYRKRMASLVFVLHINAIV